MRLSGEGLLHILILPFHLYVVVPPDTLVPMDCFARISLGGYPQILSVQLRPQRVEPGVFFLASARLKEKNQNTPPHLVTKQISPLLLTLIQVPARFHTPKWGQSAKPYHTASNYLRSIGRPCDGLSHAHLQSQSIPKLFLRDHQARVMEIRAPCHESKWQVLGALTHPAARMIHQHCMFRPTTWRTMSTGHLWESTVRKQRLHVRQHVYIYIYIYTCALPKVNVAETNYPRFPALLYGRSFRRHGIKPQGKGWEAPAGSAEMGQMTRELMTCHGEMWPTLVVLIQNCTVERSQKEVIQ